MQMDRYDRNTRLKTRMLELVALFIYKLSFDLVYSDSILYYFGSAHRFNNGDLSSYVISWLVFIFFSLLYTFLLNEDMISFSAKLLFIFSGAPSIFIFGINKIEPSAYILMIIYWINILISFKLMQKINFKKVDKYEIQDNSTKINIFTIILFLFTLILVVIISGMYGDFRLFINFEDVHYYRFLVREMNLPTIVRYGLPILGTIFVPYLLCKFLISKKIILSAITLVLGSMLYSVGGNKTWLFIYFLIILIFILMRKTSRFVKFELMAILLFILLALLSNFSFKSNNSIDLILLYDRVVSIPSDISYFYFDFFSKNEPLLLRESVLRHFFTSPYNINTPFIIGGTYLSGFGEHANNGLFGDAYSNFKEIGILIYPFMIGIIFKLISILTGKLDRRLTVSFLIILIWNLINGPFFAWLLTGGVLIYLILLILDK